MKKLFLALAMMVMVVGSAHAENVRVFLDGNALHRMCQQQRSMWYIIGYLDTARVLNYLNETDYKICAPNGMEGQQLNDTICKYLDDNPERRHWAAGTNIYNALDSAFPCE